MKVLSVASEVFPLVKTGGLADVVAALPPALSGHGVETITILPAYPGLLPRLEKKAAVHGYESLFGGPASIVRGRAFSLDLMLLDAPHLFDRAGGPYAESTGPDWPDNWRRFAALGRVAADVARGVVKDWKPDLLHAHDWQAGMAVAYLRYDGAKCPSVMTVHNLAFQGQFPASIFRGLGLPDTAFSIDGVEYYGGVGFLKAGLQSASALTTVSPTYAQEIRTPGFGMGLEGLINARAADLHGIVNGIDIDIWNPGKDDHLVQTYGPQTIDKRKANKRAVEERFGLAEDDGPIFSLVSRLTWQKGIDMLAAALDGIVAAGARLAILGSGDAALESALHTAAARHPGRVGVVIGYDERLSHLIQGGADAILVPSRFEPCGLTQLYGLRYGCVPIVARTGGLADTVIDANEAALTAGVATGFQFASSDAGALEHAVRRAATIYEDRKTWLSLQTQGMKADVSWSRSAGLYAALYRSLINGG
ncbi:MAG: glycogen synthase GlgA [Rhizobiaceae bacterium]